MEIPRLETERLILRPFAQSDFEDWARIAADPEVNRYLTGETQDREEAWRLLAYHIGHWTLRGYGQWAVEEKASGCFCGKVGLYEPEGWLGLEVGWTIAPDQQGRGIATEAGRASLRWAFDTLRADRVISIIHRDNAASVRVAEKLGERFERALTFRGFPVVVYGIDRP